MDDPAGLDAERPDVDDGDVRPVLVVVLVEVELLGSELLSATQFAGGRA